MFRHSRGDFIEYRQINASSKCISSYGRYCCAKILESKIHCQFSEISSNVAATISISSIERTCEPNRLCVYNETIIHIYLSIIESVTSLLTSTSLSCVLRLKYSHNSIYVIDTPLVVRYIGNSRHNALTLIYTEQSYSL